MTWPSSGCMICLPKGCPAIAEKLPLLMLAHILRVNKISCTPVDPALPVVADGCTCDDSMLNAILNGGSKISSVTYDGFSASFNSVGVNNVITTMGKSAWTAWLAQSPEGQMVASILSRLNRGPVMAVANTGIGGAYSDTNPILGHSRLPGSG